MRTNKDRAASAALHVRDFSIDTGDTGEPIDNQISDLIADLLHLAAENGIEPQDVLDKAIGNFEEECVDEGEQPHGLNAQLVFELSARLLTKLKECEEAAESLPLRVVDGLKDFDLGVGGILVTVQNSGGSIESDLKDIDAPIWNAAVDGIESLILGLACAGYDICAPGVITAVTTAIDAISNNLGDADEH